MTQRIMKILFLILVCSAALAGRPLNDNYEKEIVFTAFVDDCKHSIMLCTTDNRNKSI